MTSEPALSSPQPSDPRPSTGASSGTLDAVPPPATSASRATYASLWRGVPRELGFLLLTMPIAIIGLSVLMSLFWTGVGTIVIYVGVFIIVAAFYTARGFGIVELTRLDWAGRPPIPRPVWERPGTPRTFWRSVFGPFANGHYWLYLLHGIVINPIISVVSWTLTIVWASVAVGGLTGWIWEPFIPQGDRSFFLSQTVVDAVFRTQSSFDPVVGDRILYVIAGVLFAATLPFVTRGLTLLHDVVARGVLGGWPSEALQREVADLSASRGAAVAAEDQALRRLERDLHDGPQQRLIRLQMDIAAAERKLSDDPVAAAALLAEARQQAGDTLEELRALSRGFAPPILQDRGLVAAAESLAARSPIPITVESSLQPGERFSPEIERNAYYVLAELAANLAKHSEAHAGRLFLEQGVDAVGTPSLSVWLTDNGRGGASLVDGHGLRGLDERVRGLRGELIVESPVGGPTRIGARIPLT
ncbi:sensor domain-containing protein [Leifsonia sp. fls2-241-R2A-40a]|uniref:sensor histidine kinase n=1 Tax=Leifsonia sp. fls2-241-R2A-40a TaxID=3040290 RepID=UPI00254A85DE|nr:sensor domain-containing protein [Leifsonia sp. fls2-241-R2A-40a]